MSYNYINIQNIDINIDNIRDILDLSFNDNINDNINNINDNFKEKRNIRNTTLENNLLLKGEQNKITKEENKKCTNCESENIEIDIQYSHLVCVNCGQVLNIAIDYSAEWRSYDDDDSGNRCSMPINKLLPQSSMATTISGGSWKCRVKILHNWNSMPYKERSLSEVFNIIDSKCKKVDLLKCISDDAKIMYKHISECKNEITNNDKSIIIRGINRLAVIASCVKMACKKKNVTKSFKEIAELFEIKQTELTKGYKILEKLLKKTTMKQNDIVSHPENYVIKYAKQLKLNKDETEISKNIAINIKRLNIASEHTPHSIAVVSILLMAEKEGNDKLDRKTLSEKLDISEVTINKTMKKLEKYSRILYKNDIVDKILNQVSEELKKPHVSPELFEKFKKFGITCNTIINN
jgi:transcription initiation factor TFIIB